jgi:hypothetical protein
MIRLTSVICMTVFVVGVARADFSGAAISVDAKQNASGVVLSCVSPEAVIKAYKAAVDGNLAAALKAGCVTVPDGAAVMVDCAKTGRDFARIKYHGRAGWTSYDHLTRDCVH